MISYTSELISGGIGGAAGVFVGFPIDTMKVILQTSPTKMNFFDLAKEISTGGPKEFLRGLSTPLIFTGLNNAILFSSYKWALNSLKERNYNFYCSIALAGAFSGIVSLSIATPVDVIKIRLQIEAISHKENVGPIRCARSIIHQEGFRNLYKGLWVHLLRDATAIPLYFLTYELGQRYLQTNYQMNFYVATCFAGSMAGVISWIGVLPLDVLKTRIQTDTSRRLPLVIATRQVYKESGIFGFFRGGTYLAVRAVLVNGVTFCIYEYCAECCRTIESWLH